MQITDMTAESEMHNEARSKKRNYLNIMKTLMIRKEMMGFFVTARFK